MKILGYRPYHLFETVTVHGETHLKIFKEALIAQFNYFSGIRRLRKPDVEKWLADYDAIVEVPSYLGMDMIDAYAEDPDVKFILTERDPKKWALSFNNTCYNVAKMATTFPLNILKYFQADLYQFLEVNKLVYQAFANGTMPGDPDNEDSLCDYYSSYIKRVKSTIPADRLCLIRLEDGIDWDTICPFLEVPVPKENYPDRNQPARFEALIGTFLQPRILTAMLRCGALVLTVLGAGGWVTFNYGPSVLP